MPQLVKMTACSQRVCLTVVLQSVDTLRSFNRGDDIMLGVDLQRPVDMVVQLTPPTDLETHLHRIGTFTTQEPTFTNRTECPRDSLTPHRHDSITHLIAVLGTVSK